MIPIDAITGILGLVIPPVFRLFKKKSDPTTVLSDLATTKPEAVAGYTEALAKLEEMDVKLFNRDVAGTPSQWVVDLRASIRPATVVLCIFALFLDGYSFLALEEGTRAAFVANISSWISDRFRG